MRILALLPFTVLAACQPAAPDPRGVGEDETLLTVSATGQSETRPDEARFSLGVETLAGSAREASRLNAEKMERVMTALEPFDIPDEMLRTQALQLSRISYGKDRGRYRAYNVVEVRLKAVDRAGEAVTAASDAGANVVSGPNMVVSDREAATKSAYAMAYNNARLRADAYADAAGLRVARVLTIRDNGQQRGGYYPMEDMAMAESVQMAPPPPVNTAPVNPGLNRDQVSVSVAFALEPATD